MSNEPIGKIDANAIVYIREADPESLPEHLRAAPGKIFSVHGEDGVRLALTQDRNVAFALARRNDMVPVSVH